MLKMFLDKKNIRYGDIFWGPFLNMVIFIFVRGEAKERVQRILMAQRGDRIIAHHTMWCSLHHHGDISHHHVVDVYLPSLYSEF